MGTQRARPLVLDSGALIAVDRADRRVIGLLEMADILHIPAGVLGQTWRNPVRQARLARVVNGRDVLVHPLDEEAAKAAGQLCAAMGASDVIDASVVILTRLVRGIAVTSDPHDLRALDPGITLVEC